MKRPQVIRKSAPSRKPSPDIYLVPSASNSKAERLERLERIEAQIRSYSPRFNFSLFREALEWVPEEFTTKKGRKALKALTADDYFADPLVLVEELVTYVKPELEDLLGAILYPIVRPRDGKGPDFYKLDEIENKFGANVRRDVEATLKFRALNIPDSTIGNAQEHFKAFLTAHQAVGDVEQLGLCRRISLWELRRHAQILPRSGTLSPNLLRIIKEGPDVFTTDTRNRLLIYAILTHIPLLHLLGYTALEKRIADLCYRIIDPKGYETTRQDIAKVTQHIDNDAVTDAVAAYIEKKFSWLRGQHFEVEFREKDPAGARRTANRKNIPIDKVGDLVGVRVILLEPALRERQGMKDVGLLTHRGRKEFGNLCLLVYNRLKAEFGRGNLKMTHTRPVLDAKGKQKYDGKIPLAERYSYIQERLEEIARLEPRDKSRVRQENPERAAEEEKKYSDIKDGRFDDYITWPKVSGYSAVQDVMFISVPGRDEPIEVECQIMDLVRYETNMYGPRAGHVYYKAGLDYQNARDWFRAARAEMMGKADKAPRHVYVFDADDRVVEVTNNPTVAGFIAAKGLTCHEVRITNNYSMFDRNVTYGPGTPLSNGCKVEPVYS